jgi:succinoglycan biosynthesis protein ExoA
VNCFEQSKAHCLARPQPLDPPGLTPFQQAVALARASRLGHGGGSLIYSDFEGFASPQSNGAAYAREVFEQVGFVDESFDACEDVEFNFRVEKAGLVSFMSPRLAVKYFPRKELGSLFRQMVRYGAGRYKLFRKHPETLGGSTLVPPLFALCVLLTLPAALATFLGFLPIWLGLLPALALLAYTALVMLQSVLICHQYKASFIWMLPAVFFVIHFGLGWGFMRQAIDNIWT